MWKLNPAWTITHYALFPLQTDSAFKNVILHHWKALSYVGLQGRIKNMYNNLHFDSEGSMYTLTKLWWLGGRFLYYPKNNTNTCSHSMCCLTHAPPHLYGEERKKNGDDMRFDWG